MTSSQGRPQGNKAGPRSDVPSAWVKAFRSRLGGVAMAGASGVLLSLAGEPVALGPLAWLALVPLFVAVLREGSLRWAWLYGVAFGVSYFGVVLAWIFLFGWMAWTALTVVLAVYVSVATLVAGLLRRSRWAPLLVAGAWTGMELAKDRWPFGGFSWGSVGTTQGSVPAVRWLAGTVGTYGLTFVIVLVSACVAVLLVGLARPWRSLVLTGGVLLVFMAVDLVAFQPPPAEPVRVAAVQGNVPRPVRPDQRNAILASHVELTRELVGSEGDLDMIVWPEDSIGVGVSPGALETVQLLATELATPMLVGRSILAGPERSFQNLVQHITSHGEVAGTYQKRHPVPFGEYVPVTFLRRFVSTLDAEIPSDQEPGDEATVFDVDGTIVASPICFESVFGRDFLDFAREGAELFVLSTNNASFERSYAATQHLAHTRMRALETRQWVVQTALAGISGVLGPDGSVSHTTELFTADAFVAEVGTRPASSLFARTGDLFGSVFAVLALLGLVTELGRRRIK